MNALRPKPFCAAAEAATDAAPPHSSRHSASQMLALLLQDEGLTPQGAQESLTSEERRRGRVSKGEGQVVRPPHRLEA